MRPTVVSIHELKAHCASCTLRELCLTIGLGPDAMWQLDNIISNRTRVKKRDSLYRPGDPFPALFAIRLGTFKTVLLAEDGREQITGHHMAGEVVGLDGISNSQHACQAVALEDSEVCVLPFDRLDELAHDLPLLRQNLYRLISKDICRDQDMMLLLGSRSAEERLALFLLNLADRYRDARLFVERIRAAHDARGNRELSRIEAGDGEPPVLALAGGRLYPGAGPRHQVARLDRTQATGGSGALSFACRIAVPSGTKNRLNCVEGCWSTPLSTNEQLAQFRTGCLAIFRCNVRRWIESARAVAAILLRFCCRTR